MYRTYQIEDYACLRKRISQKEYHQKLAVVLFLRVYAQKQM